MAQQMFDFAESLGYHLTILDIGGGFPGEFYFIYNVNFCNACV